MSFGGDSANSFFMHGEKEPEDITRVDTKKDLEIGSGGIRCSTDDSATFSRITRTDFQILYGAYVRPLLEYANPVVYSERTKDVILIDRVQRAATKMVAGLKSMDYETRLGVLDLFPLEYRRLRGDFIPTYALFGQGLANRFFTVDPANTRWGHVLITIRHVFTRVLAPIIEPVQRAATKMVARLKSMVYETRLGVLDLFPLEYRRLRGDFIPTYALFGQGLANRFFTVDPANTRWGHDERQPLNDKNKTDPGNLGESLDPAYQSVNP
ncbi:hypothetical protein CLF_113101 [Clonorchis sinensis]|uniref:Uncharacterized protein n=1 Tax=Clonorchis sinensis TaxID=79923 RepID=G7YXM6_CLOSI|nr:hypothetical protein CLF_113101 [Clonorchis sinensis]